MAEDYAVLETLLAQLRRVRRRNLALYRALDPQGHVQSLPAVGEVPGPALLAGLRDPGRFLGCKAFRAYTGLVPLVHESGVRRAKGTRSTKAGPAWLRRGYGHRHTQAVCVVAVHLGDRLYAVRRDGRPYILRDGHGPTVDRATAQRLARSDYGVPESVRLPRPNREGPPGEKVRVGPATQLPVGGPASSLSRIARPGP